jgi:DNA polymerase III subunit alpha
MDLIPQLTAGASTDWSRSSTPIRAWKPVLKPTYGIMVYQEQVMQMAQVLAGYTLGGADLLRRAMGKKKPEEMAKERGMFESGAQARGIDQSTKADRSST